MTTSHHIWGHTPTGEILYLFRLTNSQGAYVELTNIGASWVSAVMPARDGKMENVLLGYGTADGYLNDTYYMGATIGRFANRIANASFTIDGTTYHLEKNDGCHTNHGGYSGFSGKLWEWEILPSGICFRLASPHNEGGYPGNVIVEVTYSFSEENELDIKYSAQTDQATYLNLTNHAYFNLSARDESVADHYLTVFSPCILETNNQFIPTGAVTNVTGTPFDFTAPCRIGDTLYLDNEQLKWNKGYNHCYVLSNNTTGRMLQAAQLYHPETGRELTVKTDLPGILVYTAGYYSKPHTGICLETQYFPDTPSHAHFPSCLLLPGEKYVHKTIFKFGVQATDNGSSFK